MQQVALVNGQGLTKWEVEQEVERLRAQEAQEFENPRTVYNIRKGLAHDFDFVEALSKLTRDDPGNKKFHALEKIGATARDNAYLHEFESFDVLDDEAMGYVRDLFLMDMLEL